MPRVGQAATTPYKRHVNRWKGCTRCGLCEGRKSVVIAHGVVPCDVLFIGEAPGESEDVLGVPFIGPAGKLFDQIVSDALDGTGLTWAFTNLVCCIPRDENNRKVSEPDESFINACRPRLKEFLDLCDPKLVVAVGGLAWAFMPKIIPPGGTGGPDVLKLPHPASILRARFAFRGLAAQQCVVDLYDAAYRILGSEYNRGV